MNNSLCKGYIEHIACVRDTVNSSVCQGYNEHIACVRDRMNVYLVLGIQ